MRATTVILPIFVLVACDSRHTEADAAPGGAHPSGAEDAALPSEPLGEVDGGTSPVTEPDAGTPAPEVRWYGNLKSVFAGNWGAATTLSAAVPGPNAYALGALSELRGEFLVLGGNAILVYPTQTELPRVVGAHHGHGTTESATLLVAADVDNWREFAIATDVLSTDVEGQIRATAEAQGVDTAKPFPFLLRGVFRNVGWHVADGTRVLPGMRPDTNAQHGTITEGAGTVVGFYSSAHQGVFTMMGESTHMHIVLADHAVLGHVRTLDIVAGSVLSLP